MDVAAGEQRHHLVEHVFEEGEGRLVGVEEVGKDAPIMARRRWRIGNRRECGIGSDRGGRVARHLDFGHDRDVTRGRISDDVADLGLGVEAAIAHGPAKSEEHTSELQSLMRISYAVFCLNKKKRTYTQT